MAVLWPRQSYTPAEEPQAGVVISIILSLVTMAVMSVCLCTSPRKVHRNETFPTTDLLFVARRVQNIRDWSRLPLVCWRTFPPFPPLNRLLSLAYSDYYHLL
jgi:hypothetical protein